MKFYYMYLIIANVFQCVWNDCDPHINQIWRRNFEHFFAKLFPILINFLEDKKLILSNTTLSYFDI